MSKIIACLFVVALAFTMLSGCASFQVSRNPDATPEQIAAAKALDCTTARQTVEQADRELAAPGISADAKKYWGEYSFIARLTLSIAGCPPLAPASVVPAAQ